MINTNYCKHEFLTVKVMHQRHYLIRVENWLLTSVSLDAEEEICVSATCTRCGYEVFVPSAAPREMKTPKFTKAIANFERQVKLIVDSDAFVTELCGGPDSQRDEEEGAG